MIHVSYDISCDQCGKHLTANGYIESTDNQDDLKRLARNTGWVLEFKVPNGSLWDFCSKKCRDFNK